MDDSKARCSAFDRAVNLLAFKDRTVKELKDKLKDKGYNSEEIEEAVEKLSYYGYLNDENYALSYIRENASKKGKKLILRELQEKGIDKDVVGYVMEEYMEAVDVDEIEVISNVVRRRYADADFNDEKISRRVISFFLRRGFQYDNIKAVMRNYREYDLE